MLREPVVPAYKRRRLAIRQTVCVTTGVSRAEVVAAIAQMRADLLRQMVEVERRAPK